MNLKEILSRATREGWAVGHFNASNLEQMRVIAEACRNLKSICVIGTSEGERKHIGLLEAAALRGALRREFGIPVFLNADHSKSVASAKEAADAGYDSIHADFSAMPFEENITATADVVRYARMKDTAASVEGELGLLSGESKVQSGRIRIRIEDLAKPEEARAFVRRTGVDRLAPAVGNSHGVFEEEPALDIDRIRAIRHLVPDDVALVLHGGSGIPSDQIQFAISAGISHIHINTELRIAFVGGLREEIAAHPDESTPYKLFPHAEEAMRKVVEEKLKLFGAVNRI